MATLESLQERVLLLETVTQQYRQTIGIMEEQQKVQMKSHEALHQQFLNERSPFATTTTGRIDKTLLPSKYSGDKDRWRMFSSKFVSCMAKAHPGLKTALETEMSKGQPLTKERLDGYSLSEDALNCLSE